MFLLCGLLIYLLLVYFDKAVITEILHPGLSVPRVVVCKLYGDGRLGPSTHTNTHARTQHQ